MKAINILILHEPHGTFLVRVVQQGQMRGIDFTKPHDQPRPLVEIYDTDYSFTVFGQFVTAYNFDTLRIREPHQLSFNFGVEKWRIGPENAVRLRNWLLSLEEGA